MKYRITALLASTAAAVAMAGVAYADAPAAPAPPASWASTIKFTGHLDAGITINSQEPTSGVNFDRTYDDQANKPVLNSLALTLERDVDTSAKTPDYGFKIQAAYGSDSRYNQLIGEFNRSITAREQFDIVEAHFDAHLPFLTAGGMEVHAGVMPTLEGIEVMDPTGNFFYSHSFLYNFGIPLKYTGIMTETHLSPLVDLYLGYDTGVNTFVGSGGGANDNQFHFHGGIGLNFKTVTVLASTQIGPEDFTYTSPGFHPVGVHKNRYLSDIAITWKISDALTSMTDLNYIYDDGKPFGVNKPSAYGAVEYLTYTINPIVSIGGRAEVWKDANNFYVGTFLGNNSFINGEGGYGPSTALVAAGPTEETYGEFTIGLNVKPMGLPAKLAGLTFRPEIRYDTVMQGGNAFNANAFGVPTKKDQVTFAIDVVAPFSFLP